MITNHVTRTAVVALALMLVACGGREQGASDEFHTSGSREADQRAEQRVARMQEIRGQAAEEAAPVGENLLYVRLGAEEGIKAIVEDFVNRATADPRVNWERRGVTHGGFLGIGDRSSEWNGTPENVARLKKHMAQFLTVATGGPTHYEGRNMKEVHSGMRITNAEFDAAVGDMKATLDKLGIPPEEQKELLSIMETTRPQIAEKR